MFSFRRTDEQKARARRRCALIRFQATQPGAPKGIVRTRRKSAWLGRRWRRWVPIACLLVATQAEARIRYVSPVGCDSTGYGASDVTPYRTLAYAMANAFNGDTLKLGHSAGVIASGRYSGQLVVQRYRITVIGDSAKPNAVVVPGVSLTAYRTNGVNDNFGGFTLNGVRVNGNVSIQSIDPGNADGFLMRNCVVFGSTHTNKVDASYYSNVLGVHRDSASARFTFYADGTTKRLTMVSNTVTCSPAFPPYYTDYALAIKCNDPAVERIRPTLTNNTFTIFRPDAYNPAKLSFLSGFQDGIMSGNTWAFVDSSGLTSGTSFGLLFRDKHTGNRYTNDTFTITTLRSGTGYARMDFIGVGSNAGKPQYDSYDNVWKYCTFKSNLPYAPVFSFSWTMGDRDSFTRNVVVCSTGVSRSGLYIHNVRGKAYVYRNAFMNLGGGGALMINDDQDVCASNCCWMGQLELKGNIFYTRSTGTGSSDYAVKISYPNGASLQPVISDYNVFSHYGGSGARSVNWATCGDAGANKTIAQFYALTGNDQHSVYGSPRFSDSTWANFNKTLLSNSIAIGAGPGGVDAGPYDYQDQIRPDEVNDLIASAWTTKTITLTWTDTGADSLTGTALLYDLRMSTSAITAENFSSATVLSTTFLPSVAGTPQHFTVTGLSPQTRYYFAIKLRDEFGNYSEISNLAFATTNAEGELGTAEP